MLRIFFLFFEHYLWFSEHDNKGPSNSGDHSAVLMPDKEDSDFDKCDTHSLGSWKDEAETNSYGTNVCSESVLDASPSEVCSNSASIVVETPKVRMSWADMTQEDELEGDGDALGEVARKKTELSRDQREYLRFMNVRRKKDFICLERIDGKFKNILQGLELHTGVFSAVEQKRIVDCVYELEEKGKKGELKGKKCLQLKFYRCSSYLYLLVILILLIIGFYLAEGNDLIVDSAN